MKKKVLIIEDNKDLQEIYKFAFEDEGFLVTMSDDGLTGITDAIQEKPDVILLDIMMPQMNGFEVLETITNQSSIKIPIIVCSNLSQQADIDKAYKLGADSFITKSDYTGDQIVEKVLQFLKSM